MRPESASQSAIPGQTLIGGAAAAVAMAAWAFSGIFVVLVPLPGLTVALYRLWVGLPLAAAVLLCRRKKPTWRTFWRAVPGGVLLCGDIAMFFSAVKLTSVADATVIGALQPALVLLVAGRWFGERVGPRQIGWTVLAIAGVAVVVLGGGLHVVSVSGDLLAVGSMLCWTGYWLVSKRVRAGIEPIEYTADVMIVATLAMTPLGLLSGERLSGLTGTDLIWLSLMALVPGTAHVLINWAHRFLDVAVSSVIVSVNPVVAAGLAVVVLSQPLDWLQVAGGLLAVGAVAVVAWRTEQNAPSGPTEQKAPSGPTVQNAPSGPTAQNAPSGPIDQERATAEPAALDGIVTR